MRIQDFQAREAARFGVGNEDGRKIGGFKIRNGRKNVFNDAGNRKEGNFTGEEGGDGDLVGGVEDRGSDSGGGHGLAGEAEEREAAFVDGAKFEGE